MVDELRDYFLAAAALPRDEHRRVGGGDLAGQLDGAAKRRRGAQQGDLARVCVVPFQLRLLLARLLGHEQGMDGAPDQDLQVRGREWLREIVERPLAQGFHVGVDAGVARHDDDECVAARGERGAQQRQSADLRQVKVGQYNVERPVFQQVKRLGAATAQRHLVAVLAKHGGATLAQGVLIIDDEDADAGLQLQPDGQQRRQTLPFLRLGRRGGPVPCHGYRHGARPLVVQTCPYAGSGPRRRALAAVQREPRTPQTASPRPPCSH